MEKNFTSSETAAIPEEHPLRILFHELVAHTFQDMLGMPHREITVYLGNVLTEFAHIDKLYRIHDARGERLQEVAEMLMEGDMALNAPSFEREREVHKHIGDFTLFWAGIYPESLRHLQARGRADYLINYVRQGKQSYHIVSTFQYGRHAADAGLFRQLSEDFELCLYGLSMVRRDWERLASRHIA